MRVGERLPFVTAPEVELEADRIQAAAIDGLCVVRDQCTRVGDECFGGLCYQSDRHDIERVLDRNRLRIANDASIRPV